MTKTATTPPGFVAKSGNINDAPEWAENWDDALQVAEHLIEWAKTTIIPRERGVLGFADQCQLLRSFFPPPWLCGEKECDAAMCDNGKILFGINQRTNCPRCRGTGKLRTPPPFDERWRTLSVLYVTQGIVNFKGNFDDMPILADALMDAGCDCEEMIRHCRSGGPWVREDWLLKLILGDV